ncbi:hypothetical protein BDP55DRAFT_628952 [Colletotrichum godetiae]|uniref:Ankyrin repeat protein n=1 Tax=Colletotrichum godetiae TaxID=1209918 RepID=A0AAJ0A5L3_9PEZI|nr:uncharacterized protein BDP55DRAFT_639557 [Colletotrichum godetiae]XP_060433349.1 uncharacterized protein BDP55DRAFT_628952 [Colletotrichum godetiae]KAK1656519.1 hypothetical protein BDP55DRAFT_639557 [Colletotrichum godetiae]KAK1689654.1 hypothetical protein BDP55DRAFT_628952 [Colletotrichum godetiae]
MFAAGAGQTEVLEILAEHDTNLCLKYNSGRHALEHAIYGSRPELIPMTIKTVVGLGANLEARGRKGRILPMATVAFLIGNTALLVVKQLHDCGADVEGTYTNDKTAWEVDSEKHKEDVAQLSLSIRRSRGTQVPKWYAWPSESELSVSNE